MDGVNAIPNMKQAMLQAFALTHQEAYQFAVAFNAQPFDVEEVRAVATDEVCMVEGIGLIERVYELK